MTISQTVRVVLLYFLGLLQGIAFVTYPASSIILTDPKYQNLTNNEYGSLFLPMFVAAIFISAAGGAFAKKHGIRYLLLPGIFCNAIAMCLLASTNLTLEYHLLTYSILLFSLFFFGGGFGATLTCLNALVVEKFPAKSATALTSLHALLGMGTALSPKLLSLSLEADKWWLSPFAISVLFTSIFFVVLLLHDVGAKIKESVPSRMSSAIKKHPFPSLLWVFVLITFLYGICETVVGNWSPIYLKQFKGLSSSRANDGLAIFWLCVTLGRLSISALTNWVSYKWFHAALPLLVFLMFLFIPVIHGTSSSIFMIGLTGLACSGILPLNISYGEQRFSSYREVVSGVLISAYMAGYGVASYVPGGLQAMGFLPLKQIFYIAAFPALLMAVLSLAAPFIFRKDNQGQGAISKS